MTIQPDIERELKRIQAVSGRGLLQVDCDAGRIEADLLAVDAIGCSFQTLGLHDRQAGRVPSLDELKAISETLTSQAHLPAGADRPRRSRRRSLLACSCAAVRRKKGEDGTSYYELMVRRGGDITLSRYSKKPGQLRQIVPAHVTREVLERLAEDFVGVVN